MSRLDALYAAARVGVELNPKYAELAAARAALAGQSTTEQP